MISYEPVLDKGEVAVAFVSGDGKLLQELQDLMANDEHKLCKELLDIASASLIIKCPLFVQLNLSKYGFKMLDMPISNVEIYVPAPSDIGTYNATSDANISGYLAQMAEALTLNSKGFIMDGCDKFIAQTMMPVSVYKKIIVTGTLRSWLSWLKQTSLPKPIEAYRSKVYDILLAFWKNLPMLMTLN